MAVLKATPRSELGTRKVRRLRGQGLIPGIIYGHGQDAQSVTLNRHDVDLAILHGERLLEIELDRKKQNVLLKEVQYDTFGQEVLHVDMARVSLDERVEVTVPIVLRGIPAGVNEGGTLQQTMAEVRIECVVTAIPEEIRVSVAGMQVNDSLHARDLPLPEGAVLPDDPDTVVCSVTVLVEVEEKVEGEAAPGAPEPEVIGEKKPEPEEQAE